MKAKGNLISRRQKYGYIFVLPYIIGILFLFLIPIVQSLMISFGDVNTERGYSIVVQGIKNYHHALRVDTQYLPLLLESIGLMFATVPIILVVSFIVALLLKKEFKGRIVFRCIFFLPVITASGIMKTLQFDNILSSVIVPGETNLVTGDVLTASQRIITELLLSSNLSPVLSNYIITGISNILNVLNDSGIQILIFLAALQTISPSLYEASAIEGATGWENFWKITLPMISPHILVVVVYTIINSFVDPNTKIMLYIRDLTYAKYMFGYSAAMSWIYFLVISVFVALTFLVTRPLIFYRDK
ncbi:MAG TPA: sugar ABC transporter permease [Clostridiales bacterium]|nr:sugar ABC transporter permease [Clostridiales bacterium]